MRLPPGTGLRALLFFLVASAFTTIYVPQPVLPVLRVQFGTSAAGASLAVSAVVLGIALATVPFGILADRYPVRPILLSGGALSVAAGLFCSWTESFPALVAARFLQGVAVPSLTSCLVVFLARSLPPDRLNLVLGSYVSATVAGGLGGRLLGGWVHDPEHWRNAFVSSSLLVALAIAGAARWLPKREEIPPGGPAAREGVLALLGRGEIARTYLACFGAFFVFSSVFNYLPFHLSGPPFFASTRRITALYLAYLVGIAVAPLSGRLSDRIGNGSTICAGAALFALSVVATLAPSQAVVFAALAGACAGFFAVHAAAAGALNRRLTSGRGRGNSLYVLFYYLGGSVGISASGYAWRIGGWNGVAGLGVAVLLPVFAAGLAERRAAPPGTGATGTASSGTGRS